jgi:hypothetical protein
MAASILYVNFSVLIVKKSQLDVPMTTAVVKCWCNFDTVPHVSYCAVDVTCWSCNVCCPLANDMTCRFVHRWSTASFTLSTFSHSLFDPRFLRFLLCTVKQQYTVVMVIVILKRRLLLLSFAIHLQFI